MKAEVGPLALGSLREPSSPADTEEPASPAACWDEAPLTVPQPSARPAVKTQAAMESPPGTAHRPSEGSHTPREKVLEREGLREGRGGSSFEWSPPMSLRIAVLLAAMSAAVLLLPACFGGGGSEASAPETTSGATTSPVPSPTTTAVPTTDATATETVTGLADVPTTTEKVGTDVLPKSAPPWHEELSVCKTRSFRVVYNRDIPAILVKRDNRVIAWAGLYRRDVSDECRDVPRKPPASVRVSNAPPPKGIYESAEVRCNARGRILIDARPLELHGSVNGSIVSVWVAGDSPAPRLGTTDWLVSAIVVNEIEGRRVYLNEKYCARA
jgi:hypothetical protein